MKLSIIGNGAFGSFLKELLAPHFDIREDALMAILAVPISAYEEVATKHCMKHLINVCSYQKPSTDILLKISPKVTSIHPLFGKRTPATDRHSIVTYTNSSVYWPLIHQREEQFFDLFSKVSTITRVDPNGNKFTPDSHDLLMYKTHVAAVEVAQKAKPYIEAAKDIPDHLIPNSFRLLRKFVTTLEDMPPGSLESILANPFIK